MPQRRAPLTQLHLHLSEGCDLACRHCWLRLTGASNGKPAPLLPLNLVLQAVREALPLGLRQVRLSGSASLRYPDLEPLLDYLEAQELAVMVDTDGNGMTPERAARLARIPGCSASIALDGASAATHDLLSNQPGAFETVTGALRVMAAAGLPAQVVYALTRENARELPAALRLVDELRGESVRILPVQPLPPAWRSANGGNGNGPQRPEEGLQVAELIALGWRIERELAHTTRARLVFEQPPAFRGLHPQARFVAQGHCEVLNSLAVLPTGDYTLCGVGQRIPELVFGRAGADPLDRVWEEHPTLNLLRQGMPERLAGVCERCTLKSACLGNCAVENFIRTGSFWGPNWFCEAAERMGLFPAGRLIENTW